MSNIEFQNIFERQNTLKIDEIHLILTFTDEFIDIIDEMHYQCTLKTYSTKQNERKKHLK